jgi:flagellar basal body-associated protein FliL
MADTDDVKKQESPKEEKAEEKAEEKTKEKAEEKTKEKTEEKIEEKTFAGGILRWVIMAVVVVLLAGVGFVLGRLLTGSDTPETGESSQQNPTSRAGDAKTGNPDLAAQGSQGAWYYDLEPVVANLDEPGVTRYVRATLTLEIAPDVDERKGIAFIEEKKPLLKNWLTIYLASLNLESIRGDRNLKRVQSQMLDGFNERLFPDAKPQVKHILFKEFAVQ